MDTARFFDSYYNNAEVNSIMIMDCDGTFLDVNRSFTNNFGYKNGDIKGKNFRILFNEQDNKENKPQLELEMVALKGQSHDENYIMDKSGHAIWCTGESILICPGDGARYIVKDIVNLQAKKQLQLFLKQTDEMLERIFDSSKDIPMMILDGSMKIQRVNTAFLHLFDLSYVPAAGSRLSDIDHHFWNSSDIKQAVSNVIVTNEPFKHKDFSLETKWGEKKTIRFDSKIIDRQAGIGRKIFIIMEDISSEQVQ